MHEVNMNSVRSINPGLMFPQSLEDFSGAVGKVCGRPSVCVATKSTRYRGMSPAGYAAHREREHGITQELLREMFDYDPENGLLVRKKRVPGKKPSADVNVRRALMINGKTFNMNRAVYIWHFGSIPGGQEVDHIDRNPLNDRIENLRLVSRAENQRNHRIRGATKYRGVHLSKGKFGAHIKVNYEPVYIGMFDSAIEAAAMYDAAVAFLFGQNSVQNPTNSSEGMFDPMAQLQIRVNGWDRLPGTVAVRIAANLKMPMVTLVLSPAGRGLSHDGATVQARMVA